MEQHHAGPHAVSGSGESIDATCPRAAWTPKGLVRARALGVGQDGVEPRAPPHDGGREGGGVNDPIADIMGDYRAFATQQRDRLLARGIDIGPSALSHLASRVPEWDQ